MTNSEKIQIHKILTESLALSDQARELLKRVKTGNCEAEKYRKNYIANLSVHIECMEGMRDLDAKLLYSPMSVAPTNNLKIA
jgi:hypothetical protein